MNNYYDLLNIKYKKHIIIYFILVTILILLIISLNVTSYDSYTSYGIYKDNNIYVSIPVNNSDNLLTGKYLSINKKKYKYDITNISELYEEGSINYQTYEIQIEKVFKTNEVIKITFYSNKEKIIKKIKKIIF